MSNPDAIPEPGDFDDADLDAERLDPGPVALTLSVALDADQTQALDAYAARRGLDLTEALHELTTEALAARHVA